MVPSQDSNQWSVNRKSIALPILPQKWILRYDFKITDTEVKYGRHMQLSVLTCSAALQSLLKAAVILEEVPGFVTKPST